ncbi:probable GH family 25 lysozyme 3 [Notothenia coriiceps]|uniref:Probable GH family 25 lysozyme 3 n=1 Tax=Notothenia coriiceps TaxID=8208 RepID=A0A6I9Q528_9TELE|nr:PREDICTED: probable GH family 25 lysozyme 3 [Notothenia coriiceps]
METWFLNHVLGVSLSVLLLGLPGPLGAGTPSNNVTDPVTAGFYSSPATEELSSIENNATSTSSSSESLSSSQRNILLTHSAETHTAAAGSFDTEQIQTFTETSSMSLEALNVSTGPLSSTLVVASTEGSSSSSSSGSSTGNISSSSGGSTSGSGTGGSSTGSGSTSGSGTSGSSTGGSSSTSVTVTLTWLRNRGWDTGCPFATIRRMCPHR